MATDAELHRAAHERLHNLGQRYTTGRRSLVVTLAASPHPVTLPDLLERDSALPQSSAYRNLSVLEQAGVVRRLVHSTGHAHYELAEDLTTHHHHMICENCGIIRDITLAAKLERSLDKAFADVTETLGFSPRHHAVDIYGLCADCR
jgi:Fur family transcriptional regulator, ferric uptake regulator